ncbi:MAG TPA: flagellar hook-length control protein FliK, partial [Stellaceae bacterium]|nr:flagellar hook-length control protein FliK [Stellaceae bacterium]
DGQQGAAWPILAGRGVPAVAVTPASAADKPGAAPIASAPGAAFGADAAPISASNAAPAAQPAIQFAPAAPAPVTLPLPATPADPDDAGLDPEAVDPTGVSVAAGSALPATSGHNAQHRLLATPAVLASALPAAAVQPGLGGGGFGGDTSAGLRDRFAPAAAGSGTGDAVAAATPGGDGRAALDAPGTAPTSAGDGPTAAAIPDQVAGHLVRLVSSGSREMVMHLRPPELGDLTVRVAVSGRDVSAWFASPQPQVQSAISAALGQLQTSLGDAGYNLSGAWVGADASGAQQQGANPTSVPRAAVAAAARMPAAPAAPRPSVSGLNIYV